MSELKACPLCGAEITTIETHPGRGEIYCGACDLVLGGNEAMTPDELTEKWNRRALEQATAATPGDGECEWVLEHSGCLYDRYQCSKCGYSHVESKTDCGVISLDPNFCPNCGKAVKP